MMPWVTASGGPVPKPLSAEQLLRWADCGERLSAVAASFPHNNGQVVDHLLTLIEDVLLPYFVDGDYLTEFGLPNKGCAL
jgi:hypothetical protein